MQYEFCANPGCPNGLDKLVMPYDSPIAQVWVNPDIGPDWETTTDSHYSASMRVKQIGRTTWCNGPHEREYKLCDTCSDERKSNMKGPYAKFVLEFQASLQTPPPSGLEKPYYVRMRTIEVPARFGGSFYELLAGLFKKINASEYLRAFDTMIVHEFSFKNGLEVDRKNIQIWCEGETIDLPVEHNDVWKDFLSEMYGREGCEDPKTLRDRFSRYITVKIIDGDWGTIGDGLLVKPERSKNNMTLYRVGVIGKLEASDGGEIPCREEFDIKAVSKQAASDIARELFLGLYPDAYELSEDITDKSHSSKKRKTPKKAEREAHMLFQYAVIRKPEEGSKKKEELVVPISTIVEKSGRSVRNAVIVKHAEELKPYADEMDRIEVLIGTFGD